MRRFSIRSMNGPTRIRPITLPKAVALTVNAAFAGSSFSRSEASWCARKPTCAKRPRPNASASPQNARVASASRVRNTGSLARTAPEAASAAVCAWPSAISPWRAGSVRSTNAATGSAIATTPRRQHLGREGEALRADQPGRERNHRDAGEGYTGLRHRHGPRAQRVEPAGHDQRGRHRAGERAADRHQREPHVQHALRLDPADADQRHRQHQRARRDERARRRSGRSRGRSRARRRRSR